MEFDKIKNPLVVVLLYLVFIPVFYIYQTSTPYGNTIAILVLVPVLFCSYVYGVRGGIASALFSIVLVAGLIFLKGSIPPAEFIEKSTVLLRAPTLIILALIAGKLSDLNRKLQQEIIQRKQAELAAQKALQIKSDFLATMSHELRTPMNGVIGMSSLLQETELSKEQRHFTEIISNSASHLLFIINEILDYSRIESGKMTLESNPYNIRKTIQDTLAM